MSDSSSILSCDSCDSDLFEVLSSELSCDKIDKKQVSIIQALYNREIGLFVGKPKFPDVPDRLKFNLSRTLPTSSLASHVFLGLSKCGQLLITYTYTTDMDDRPMSFNTIYKYRLHWWAFVPYARARKVAEVTLFGNHNVYTPLYLAVCQWPSDYTKIVVYGNCFETYVGLVGQTERSYVTVTAVPSLHNCVECQKVAASFEEEDIAASWDSCVRFSCLVHGLTVHTTFDVAPPYPKFRPTISMNYNGRVVLNTGNFLHIIRVDLENPFKGLRAPKSLHESCQSQPDHFSIRSRTLATSNVNVRMSEYQALLGLGPSSPFASSSDHTSCDNRSLLEELNITCQPGYVCSSPSVCYRPDLLMLETDSDGSSQLSTILSPPLKRRSYHLLSPSTSPRGQQGRLTSKTDAGKAYEFNIDNIDGIHETFSSFRRRRLADKKYEFSVESEDAENIVPFRLIRHSQGGILESSTHHQTPSSLTFSRDRSFNRASNSLGEPPDLSNSFRRKAESVSGIVDGESPELLSPGGVLLDVSMDQDKVVLRPQNRNHALLSPREQDIRESPRESSKKAVQVHLDNNSISLPPAPMSSPPHTLQSKAHPSEKHERNGLTAPSVVVNPTNAPLAKSSNNNTEEKSGCTVQFERRFIEVDDELVSVITDIEDDDESGSTGYHSALPLEVHGSGYVQMQMISNTKAEKLMAPCALVHQMSFDIEQFCHEVAATVCEQVGMKFWYCNNYDVEVVDVCPQSGDVICLAFMKIKATVKNKSSTKCERMLGERQQYETSCVLVWNMNSGAYQVEGYGPLNRLECDGDVKVDKTTLEEGSKPDGTDSDDWNPARKGADKLRLKNSLNCKAAYQPPVRVLSNAPVLLGTSLKEIKDEENGISFVL